MRRKITVCALPHPTLARSCRRMRNQDVEGPPHVVLSVGLVSPTTSESYKTHAQ